MTLPEAIARLEQHERQLAIYRADNDHLAERCAALGKANHELMQKLEQALGWHADQVRYVQVLEACLETRSAQLSAE